MSAPSPLTPVRSPRGDAALLFLERDVARPRRLLPFVLAGLVLHAAAFAVQLPRLAVAAPVPERPERAFVLQRYVPPPPEIQRPVRAAREIEEALPVPDLTPLAPEPIIDRAPEEIPEVVPQDLPTLVGEPEPPAVAGPLVAGQAGVTLPELIAGTDVEPVYPELARRARIEGDVTLRAVIYEDGLVGDIEVLAAPRGDLGFVEAALAAVRQWRYRPASQAGRPVAVYLGRVHFRLD
jgi:protein TonB